MKDTWYQKEIDEMIEILSKISNKDELKEFLGHILTSREINDMARRRKVWEMLEGGYSYSDIAVKLGASPNFISRISSQIGFGFRRSPEKVKKSKVKIDPGKYLKKDIKYKGFKTGIHA